MVHNDIIKTLGWVIVIMLTIAMVWGNIHSSAYNDMHQSIYEISEDERRIWVVAGALLVVFIGLLFLIFYQRRELKKKEIQRLESIQRMSRLDAVIEGEEFERSKLAYDLNEKVNGRLSAVKHSLSVLSVVHDIDEKISKHINGTLDVLDVGIEDIRNISNSLAPPSIVQDSLVDMVSNYCNRMTLNKGLPIHFKPAGNIPSLSRAINVDLYKVARDLIQMAATLENLDRVILGMEYKDDTIEIKACLTQTSQQTDNAVLKPYLDRIRLRSEDLGGTLHISESSIQLDFSIQIRFNQEV